MAVHGIVLMLVVGCSAPVAPEEVAVPPFTLPDTVTFAEQTEQNVFSADVGMIERLGLLRRQGEDFLDAWGVRDVADHFLVRPGANQLLDLHANGFEVKVHLLEHIDRDTLAKLDEAQQEMLGADEIMVETVSFFARQRQHLLGTWRKIVHGFFAHTCCKLL